MNEQGLIKQCYYFEPKDLLKLKKALELSKKAHQNIYRRSGEPYFNHPLKVAETLAQMNLDPPTIIAALLHDLPEDTKFSLDDLRRDFGKEIAHLVDGVTKLGKVRIKKSWFLGHQVIEETPEFDQQVETLRKMFLAMAQDIRVILIKLADREHNMETLNALEATKQQRIARETLEIYARIADRLGMGELKGRLEDLAFPYIYPEEYHWLLGQVEEKFHERQKYLAKATAILKRELGKNHIEAEIHGRAKHYYSLYQKLIKYDRDFSKIYDLVALRIIVPTIENCYATLGIIHQLWKPLLGRIKDFISMPKPNGYQSLHTTVFCLEGKIVEIQIRTPAMHFQAEFGIAAHWHYTETKIEMKGKDKSIPLPKEKLVWVKELARLQQKFDDPEEFAQALKLDFFQDRIFVFTPKGDVIDLPVGSTPIDFAFRIHSEIGNHCIGAKVNDKMVTLGHLLQNGDLIEILQSKKSVGPKRDWLEFARTSQARSRIKAWLKTKEHTPKI